MEGGIRPPKLIEHITRAIIGDEHDPELQAVTELFIASKRMGLPLVEGGLIDQPYLLTAVVFGAIEDALNTKLELQQKLTSLE